MKKDKPNNLNRRLKSDAKQAYWTITQDLTDSTYGEMIVEAHSRDEALAEAVTIRNRENDYGPDEDGGFRPVAAYNHQDLLSILEGLGQI